MRIISILLELLIVSGLGFIIFQSIFALIISGQKKDIWNSWLKSIENEKNITSESLLFDINTILKVSEKNIPEIAYNHLLSIKGNIEIIKSDKKSLEQIRTSYPDDFLDLLSILHKYIPESLTKYFSIPKKLAQTQTHRNGKTSDVLLIEAFESIDNKISKITQRLVSEKINELKTYQTFIHQKFD